jgi:hypothetical protein
MDSRTVSVSDDKAAQQRAVAGGTAFVPVNEDSLHGIEAHAPR